MSFPNETTHMTDVIVRAYILQPSRLIDYLDRLATIDRSYRLSTNKTIAGICTTRIDRANALIDAIAADDIEALGTIVRDDLGAKIIAFSCAHKVLGLEHHHRMAIAARG